MRDITIKNKDFLVDNVLIATGYTRVVHGARGKYLEVPSEYIIKEQLEVEPGQEYRLESYWKNKAYYAWYRTITSHIKVYYQYKKVLYADYLVGYYYIDPTKLSFEGDLYTEKSDKPLD